MALSRIWVSMICVALAFGAASGRGAQLGAAAAQGVQQAVDFCLTVGGMICLWSGVMELMRRCGIAGGLSRLLRPVLRRLFPHAARDVQALDALSMNVSANLLGLGNAATPAGVRAARQWRASCAATPPATSCACLWCSTQPRSSCCRSRSPPCARQRALPCRSTFCPPYG